MSKNETTKKHYISAKESRQIAKQNSNEIKRLQKQRAAYKREDYVTQMRDPSNIVEFDDLHTYFFTDNGTVKAVNGVSFDIPQGSTVGVVGESGCGKSVTSLSLMQLVQGPMGQIVSGSIRFRTTVKTPRLTEPVMKDVLDENGEPVLDPETGLPRQEPELDEKGKPVMRKVPPVPIMEEVYDHSGAPVLRADGSVFTRQARRGKGKPKIVTVEETQYEDVTDADGNVQLDENGVVLRRAKLDKNGKPIVKKIKKPLLVEVKDEDGNVLCDPDGAPYMEQAYQRAGKPKFKPVYDEKEEVYDIAKMPAEAMYNIRGREIAMIFQEPMTSLNPVFTVGYQLDEVTLLHVEGADKEDAKKRSIEMLKLVGIAMPEHVYKSYPHQLSGGMRQRVMIAMALCCNPKLIIADEPTTALDVTIQAQILDLLREVKNKISGSIMLITHDLGVIAEMVDYVVVMYAGRVVEKGTVREIFKNPLHPYTIGLQKSKPVVGQDIDRLYSIPGNVPNPINMLSTCYFKDRCGMKCAACRGDYPEMVQVSPTHFVACHRYKDLEKEHENEQAQSENANE